MGRHAENELRVQSLVTTLEDRYLIGYFNNAPLSLTLNTFTGVASIQNGARAIEDQKAINRAKGITESITCVRRYLVEKPVLYYGFKDQQTGITRDQEIEVRKKAKSLSNKMGIREIDRQLYGDEVICVLGKFKRQDKIYLEAVGCVKTKENVVKPIRQVLCEIPQNKTIRINYVGGHGICGVNNRKRDPENYIEWQIMKQELGCPVIEVTIETDTKTYELDLNEYKFHLRKTWEFEDVEESDN